MNKQRVVIVGGGFAGITCALELARSQAPVHIRLISDRSVFEYHGALYRLVAGGSPLEVCLPLRDIFQGLDVDVIVDPVVDINTQEQVVTGHSRSTYGYDHLVMALGSQTNYFNIPGLAEHSLGMKTISDAFRLKHHITNTLSLCPSAPLSQYQQLLHFVIVGAGPTGVELAGELAGYVRHLVRRHGLDPQMVTIDLVERSERILPKLHPSMSAKIQKRLKQLGVTVCCECSIESMQDDQVVLSGRTINSPTVVWTAGVRAHELMDQLGVEQDRMGRVVVNNNMQVVGLERVYIAGDVAATPHSGMAQTAINDGRYVADCIERTLSDPEALLHDYSPGEPIYSIPAGPGWAGTQWGRVRVYGRLGWVLRRWVDFKVFLNLLPLPRAWSAFRAHYRSEHPQEICD